MSKYGVAISDYFVNSNTQTYAKKSDNVKSVLDNFTNNIIDTRYNKNVSEARIIGYVKK
jgi:hypothetical protein